jgi:hypothetical protein
MKKNTGIKVFLLTVGLLTLALFLALNMTPLLTGIDPEIWRGADQNTLAWQDRPVDLVILLFFLVGGALASLRVLPHKGEVSDE